MHTTTSPQTSVKRTPFMSLIMLTTQPNVFSEALSGGFDGAWERLIAKRLEAHKIAGNSEAEMILEAAEGDSLKAAYMVTSSTIQE